MKILVADDEALLVKGLKYNLEIDGWEVVTAGDGVKAVELVRAGGIDLVLMDLMMPEKNGLDACMDIRQFSQVPIIMLTAKSEDTDKLIGFEYGADDYVTKPFNVLELKARIRALLRRSQTLSGAADETDVMEISGVRLSPQERTITADGREVELTAKEFDLVEFLMRNAGKVFTRENLLELVWGEEYRGDIRTVDVHVRRIREKLESDPASPTRLMTKWGVGYYFKG